MTFSLAFRPTTVAALGIALLLALSLLPAPSAAGSTSPPICELSEETIVGVQGSTGGPIEIVGTKGNDVILGSSGPDVITGLGGDDVICGAGGDDFIDGGSGVD